ncbi:chromosome transmission fidelity protein 8 [Syncephalis fuscata]|nr:chromosome transmission fidelity protein 8 [Syncephalis fuscata]
MVQLFVHVNLNNQRELVLIELQGKLATQPGESRDNLHVGNLTIEPNGTVIMFIGYHRLEGKIIVLKKPLAILQRVSSTKHDSTPPPVNYNVIDILRHKIVFNLRPEPVGLLE